MLIKDDKDVPGSVLANSRGEVVTTVTEAKCQGDLEAPGHLE